MCNVACIQFVEANLTRDEVVGKRVLDVGSRNVNGSVRAVIEKYTPEKYWGVDIVEGKGVDEICNAGDLVARFGKESFDVVVSTEMLEHVRDWRKVIFNMKQVLKPHGIMLLTTRSKGFKLHNFPEDHWRYEIEDMAMIFSDMQILANEKDTHDIGVFVKVRKSDVLEEVDLVGMELFSIIKGVRCRDIE